MHICFFAEGCYPYVVGGVSSWLHSLITSMPQHQFTVVTLGAYGKDRGVFKYKIPSNIIEIRENFIDEISHEKGRYHKKYKFGDEDIKQFDLLFNGEDLDWRKLIDFVKLNKGKNPQDFIMSRVFYDVMIKTYEKNHSASMLSDFFWTIRSMILPLMGIMAIDVPKADIYHSISAGYAGVMAAVGSMTYNKPMILTEHGLYTREREEEIIGADWISLEFKDLWIKYFQNLSKCAYNYTDLAITLFDNAKELQNELGCEKDKQIVVFNGVDVDSFSKLKTKKLGDPDLNIGAVVRIVPIKDILTMIQAFKIVSQTLPEAKYYIMGPTEESPEYYEECTSIVRLLEMEDKIIFTGRINVKEYLPLMDLMVLSSISEGQPLSVLESLAAGIPNITTNVGSCEEILYGTSDDNLGDAGIIVPIMDYKKMAGAIIKICTDKSLHKKMSYAGRARVKTLYSKKDFINKYKEIYDSYKKES